MNLGFGSDRQFPCKESATRVPGSAPTRTDLLLADCVSLWPAVTPLSGDTRSYPNQRKRQMALAQDAADVSGELSGSGSADRDEFVGADRTEEELLEAPPGDGALLKTEQQIESGAKVFIPHQSPLLDPTSADTSRSNLHHSTTKTQCLGVEEEAPNTNSTKDDLEEPNCEAATKSNADSKTTIITSDNADKHETKNIAGVAATDTAKTTAGIASTNATKTNTSNICLDETKSTPSKPPSEPTKTALDKANKGSGFSSSTPARRRLSIGPPSSPLLSESTIAHVRLLEAPVEEKGYAAEVTQQAACAILKDSPPQKKMALSVPIINKDGGAGGQDPCRRTNIVARNPRRLRFGSKGSEDGTSGTVCPSARWGHSTCLCDPETAILIGGEGANEKSCQDSLWKLELDSDFWFQMDSLCSGSAPQCSRGHTATFDPETKKVFVYGGMRDKHWFSNIYMLDTLHWKWTLVTAVGKVPTLSYHTATMYQRELYVFGGLCPQVGADVGICTNALYIFNPEYKIWYQPIVEGERPLSRYGHSATLLSNRLVLFGGRRSPSPVYLNDVHILDLGYMEYTAVSSPSLSERPSPRCFHAAMQVSEYKLLIHGGCSGSGSLADAFIFSLDTLSWNLIKFGGSSQVPRAGHTLLNLTSSSLTDSDKEKQSHPGLS
ncbi:uncharacterized protein [Engystomops pustulosus]|uniref:uncharacterized protein isoform X2 n=1 Tax=Engystomops pustulosus TaxID=76066 RepID=UPI003AFAE74C